MAGNTDKPIERKSDDVLKVKKYIDGLSNFINVCDTPMTMAIQGDWGSGKTSFMNMIREEIKDDVVTIWFNTWQFSQFHLEDTLTLTLLTALVDSLNIGDTLSAGTKQTIKKLGKIAVNVGTNFASNFIGVDIAENIRSEFESENIVDIITGLKDSFQKCVDNSLLKKKKDKIVIFIDDLDRLPPERAVEVLEILKLFLDCDKCVFLLAIDYDVVCRGIGKKYGEGFDMKKGRNFFDKIIQVPFKMPIAHYEIENYIRQALKNMGFITDNSKVYVDLISKSIGYNPRGMKRILNAYLLLKMVYADVDLNNACKQATLFAVLCLQMSYEDIYNYIIINEDDNITSELLSSIASLENSDSNLAENFFEAIASLGHEDDIEEIKEFMKSFCNAMVNNSGKITEMEYETLISILKISGTTSSISTATFLNNGKSGKSVRYGNTFDENYSYHVLSEKLEKTNEPTGWNGCKIEGYKLFNEEYKTNNFSELLVRVLSVLYMKNTDKFREIYNNSEKYKLYGLFYGSRGKDGLVEPKLIPNTEIRIESKNSYDAKVKFLRKILTAMGYNESDLCLNIKLAHRIG